MIRPVTMLAGVSVVLVILLAPYLRPWLAQRSDIATKRAQVDALQRQVDQLQAERARWNDPAFVKAQARDRLNFVMPGDLGYVVLDDDRQQSVDPAQQAALDAGRISGRPWYDVLWQSVQLAGHAPTNGSGSNGSGTSGSGTSGPTAPAKTPGPASDAVPTRPHPSRTP